MVTFILCPANNQKNRAMNRKYISSLVLLFLFPFILTARSAHSGKSDFMSYKGLAMAGYQGWFNAPDDGADRGWNHYNKQKVFRPGMCNIDAWPEISEYDKKYKTVFVHQDGSPAYVFSSYDKSTVDLHFKWMHEYGIDGVFMQRFVQTLKSEKGIRHSNTVLANALCAAQKYDRAICVMYDLSGMNASDAGKVIEDWKYLVDSLKLTSRKDNKYLYHNGKPLVAIWGVGFAGRKYGYPEYRKLLEFFINDKKYGRCSILLGVPASWRELGGDTDRNQELHDIIKMADIVHPWFVGRYNENTFNGYIPRIKKDMEWCDRNGLDYVPVIWPGFSWHNKKNEAEFNHIPRNGGRFFWKQIAANVNLGAEMFYYAMFDEVDEGTAIFKISNDPPVGESPFLDNDGLPSDWYLRLAGYGGMMMRHEVEYSEDMPSVLD